MKERIYTINLKREFLKGARWKKSQKASYAVRSFLKKHMKTDEDKIKIGSSITEKIWEHGNQKPPTKIRIKVIQTDEGIVKAEMFGAIFPEELTQEKKKEKKEKTKEESKEEKSTEKSEEEKKQEIKEKSKEEKKEETKEKHKEEKK